MCKILSWATGDMDLMPEGADNRGAQLESDNARLRAEVENHKAELSAKYKNHFCAEHGAYTLDCDACELQRLSAELEALKKAVADYHPLQGAPCPFCKMENGRMVELCGFHREHEMLFTGPLPKPEESFEDASTLGLPVPEPEYPCGKCSTCDFPCPDFKAWPEPEEK